MSVLEIRHQPAAQFRLQRALASARLPHAYLFHGPDGVGRESLARQFAALLLCRTPCPAHELPPEYADLPVTWQDACGQCESCARIPKGAHPDCHIIHRHLARFHDDAAVRNRKAQDLSVDVIRRFVIEPAARTAVLTKGRVFIIRECERLSSSAQNALLKTLEEPPEDTYLILLCTTADRLLPTTRSRCQEIPFGLLPQEFIAGELQNRHPQIAETHRRLFSRHEAGSLGIALQLIEQEYEPCNRALLAALSELRRGSGLKLADRLEKLGKKQAEALRKRSSDNEDGPTEPLTEGDAQRQVFSTLLALMATTYRDLLSLGLGASDRLCNPPDALRDLAGRVTPPAALEALRALAHSEHQLARNGLLRLWLDGLALRLARLHGL